MTHQNHQTNGASLEDCHTNFFALTELCGIKWRKLTWGGGGGGTAGGLSPLDDPVLSSYARCLAGDVLCVWRRVAQPPPAPPEPDAPAPPPAPPPPPLSLDSAKELWIFWYGEEPDLMGLVSPELIDADGDQGSWELGLSYECRSLLFKALHNLIERCLLSRDFVRLGKWFVQPYDGDEDDITRSCWHLSFSFAFFVHGESTVCASVDVRQHPPVRRLAALKPPPHNTKVILAPFGLKGTLVSPAPGAEPVGGAMVDAWRHFYPLEEGLAVEVAVGGVRMRYPARYTLLTQMDSPTPREPTEPPPLLAHRTLTQLGLQESELIGGTDPSVDMKPTKEWEFVDPTRRTNCSCSKCPSVGGSQGTPGGGSPGSCGGGSPCGGPSPAAPASAPAPPTPRPGPTAPPVLALPHTPAPTPPQHPHTPHTPHTPRPNQTCLEEKGESLKRPILALQEAEPDPLEEERPLDLLYDYSTLHAWLNHPVKKLKHDEGCEWEWWEEGGAVGGKRGEDLYAGHTHTKMAPVDPVMPCNGALPSYLKGDLKQESNQDDANKENKNLFTSDGLQASYKDLDQIFDNSDDTSGDETVRLLQVHTPPDSNKSAGCGGEEPSGGLGTRGTRGPGAVRPEELCKMFPTPPSLEPSLQASPSAFTLPEPEHATLMRCGSPPDEPIVDWTFVFKPPTICKYVGATKYAALSGLSSGAEPPHCVYRPSWQQGQGGGTGSGGAGAERSTPRAPSAPHQAPRTPRTPHHNLLSVGSISQPASVSGAGSAAGGGPVPPSPCPSPAPSSPAPAPHQDACALLLNLLLADTAINIFRDHNFDSCTMCVCNAGPKVVGNIRGADSGVYLWGSPLSPDSPTPSPAPPAAPDEEPIRCSCGFSAVVNRRLAHRAGLFYEDEMEITGLAEDPTEYKREGGAFGDTNRSNAAALVELVREQCGVLSNSASALQLCAAEAADRLSSTEPRVHLLEYADCKEAAGLALEAAAGRAGPALHRWPFLRAPAPSAGRDVVRLMRRLQPLLQDAIQKKCSTRMWDAVAGPLTWRQFHRLAGRGTEDLCEPQPVPPLLVGHDRDWVALSPHALHYWDRLLLEPYSYSRDVAYVVLLPDSAALQPRVGAFFRDLSTAYEQCRLGRHAPLARLARDGLLRVPRTPRPEPLDDWFNSLAEGTTTDILRLYAQMCRGVLAPALSAVQMDHTLLEPEGSGGGGVGRPPPAPERPAPSPMAPPEHPPTPTNNDHEGDTNSNSGTGVSMDSSGREGLDGASAGGEEEGSAPCVVVYLVEPGAGGERRTSCLAMLRAASTLLHSLPDHIRANVSVQLISWESICEAETSTRRRAASLRSLALSVFSQCRRQLQHLSNIKSLTGFGTAANADLFLKNKDEKNRMPYRLYVPPYVLAPPRPLKDIADTFGQPAPEACAVLYLSYCLSADQSWLLAVATDGRGELLDSCSINVDVPGRARRRRAPPARRLGLTKLMDFTLGVMSQSVQPWRLVVGRIGRIGHGELKGWSWLLSRKNLLKASQALREVCASCSLLYPGGAPCILSACLVSTEPDSALRLLADQFTPDERFSQASVASHLSTPQDVSCTHILVFPTSATTQSSQTAFQEQHINGPELGDDELFSALNDDMPDGIDSMNDFSDIFNGWAGGMQSPGGSPGSETRRGGDGEGGTSRPGSPGRPANHHGTHSPMSDDGNTRCGWEEVGALLQQPLALGYLVSTAPLGRMPRWWWAACPHAAPACPAFLKNALHLHSPAVQQTSDDLLQQPQPQPPQHPLDSQLTTDVLRYVLEGYNALSWLALDSNSQDRLSCLPAHVQVLMQLYHLTAALV